MQPHRLRCRRIKKTPLHGIRHRRSKLRPVIPLGHNWLRQAFGHISPIGFLDHLKNEFGHAAIATPVPFVLQCNAIPCIAPARGSGARTPLLARFSKRCWAGTGLRIIGKPCSKGRKQKFRAQQNCWDAPKAPASRRSFSLGNSIKAQSFRKLRRSSRACLERRHPR